MQAPPMESNDFIVRRRHSRLLHWRRLMYQYKFLIGRVADPAIGVIIGCVAYFVFELRNPRAPGHSLTELLRDKYVK